MLVYLDASVMIEWMQGRAKSDSVDRYDNISFLLQKATAPISAEEEEAAADGMRIAVSAILMYEVRHHAKHERKHSEFKEMVGGFEVVLVDETIAERAAALTETYGLKAMDAIHVATAIEHEVDYLLTTDKGMLRIADAVLGKGGVRIQSPSLPLV